jgi:predicted hotdog family 3-hydroxylacyl-ACP dehydratase
MTRAVADPLCRSGPDLLPHTGTARLLTEIVRSGRDFVEAICLVPASHPLATGDRAPCFLGLELGAQAAAVLEALDRATATGDSAPRVGYLVRVRAATFLRPDFPVDTPLFVTAHLERAAPPLGTFRISVSVDGIEFLQATLVTYGRT